MENRLGMDLDGRLAGLSSRGHRVAAARFPGDS